MKINIYQLLTAALASKLLVNIHSRCLDYNEDRRNVPNSAVLDVHQLDPVLDSEYPGFFVDLEPGTVAWGATDKKVWSGSGKACAVLNQLRSFDVSPEEDRFLAILPKHADLEAIEAACTRVTDSFEELHNNALKKYTSVFLLDPSVVVCSNRENILVMLTGSIGALQIMAPDALNKWVEEHKDEPVFQ